MNRRTKAFTLAEVLIALVVIGIIAAITLTTVMPNIQERVNSQRQANIVYKVTQATNLMKANGGMINGFESTDAFVDELQKYLKIMKRCDSEHIAECWPTKKVRTSKGKEFDVKDAKLRKNLGFEDDYKNVPNVGIVLADGACLIMTYNPSTLGLSIGEPITAITTELPAGGRYQTFLDYTSNTTGGLAFVMDVNGNKGPNSEPMNNKKYDIRSFNLAQFSEGCLGTKIDGKCYVKQDSISPVDCSHTPDSDYSVSTLNQPENASYCGAYSTYSRDYWAGAQKACAIKGMKVPSQQELKALCNKDTNHVLFQATSTTFFWSSDMQTGTYAPTHAYNTFYKYAGWCDGGASYKGYSPNKVICVDI